MSKQVQPNSNISIEIKPDIAAIERLVEAEFSAYNLLDGYDSPTLDMQNVLADYGIQQNTYQ